MSKSITEREFYASQRLIWAFFVIGGIGGFFAAVLMYFVWLNLGLPKPGYTFIITWALVALFIWGWLMIKALQRLGILVLRDTGSTEIIIKSADGHKINPYKFKWAAPHELKEIARQVRLNNGITVRILESIIGNRASLFLNELMEYKLIEWKDPKEHRGGRVITDDGWDLFDNEGKRDADHLSPTQEI